MIFQDLPQKSGLYDPNNEHDACGIGAIVNIKGIKSHTIIKESLEILNNLEHRGGTGAEDNTGDGAGILVQIPHKFFKSLNLGFSLGAERSYGVAQLFLSRNEETKQKGFSILFSALKKKNLELLGIRKVPYNDYNIGITALEAMPYIVQVFVKKPEKLSENDFERLLFETRRIAEKEALKLENHLFYFCSFSSKTIVYKGMLLSTQVRDFYLDLMNTNFESAIALVHSRFSTNTFPSWERAHPNRMIIHNGEINTIKGNVDLIKARESLFKSNVFENSTDVLPIIAKPSSDSAMFDNTLEYFVEAGIGLPEALMMMIPEPWEYDNNISKKKKAFYQYASTLMESWDGPASIVATDGDIVVATLDRNGLRPSRYLLTDDDMLILSSETGTVSIKEEHIKLKSRLEPGKLLIVDIKKQKVISDEAIKEAVINRYSYSSWEQNLVFLDKISVDYQEEDVHEEEVLFKEHALGYSYDSVDLGIIPLATNKEELLVAMGNDTPLAIFSNVYQSVFNYFKEMFAQVTNPPIDSLREEIVTSTRIYLGAEGNIFNPNPSNMKRVVLSRPLISNSEMAKIFSLAKYGFKVATLDMIFDYQKESLEKALDRIANDAVRETQNGASILVLSDQKMNHEFVSIPSLLAVVAIHKCLVAKSLRTHTSIVVLAAEPREIHHYATLLGFGANAICPYLVYSEIGLLVKKEYIKLNYSQAIENYIKGSVKGIVKISSKMGISTIQAYNSSRIFEVIGLAKDITEKYFSNIDSKIGGLTLNQLEQQIISEHKKAINNVQPLYSYGIHGLRNGYERHLFNPLTIYKLQYAVKNNDYEVYKEFAKEIDSLNNNLRNAMDFREYHEIDINEVESADVIVKRFKTGAMSYGSISQEAHECLAKAMNMIGAKSNTGEGGENKDRPLDSISAIKQIASGRFGVTISFLASAKEIQIKIAQGAKPGEGGQLPGKKVYPWVADARHSTPGVSLISPPPHHDIYSIEDLSQLIYDLKNANPQAIISVKLVSEDGIGTIASGVAKAGANTILISGYDGGTGASPRTSISNTGMPWELGLADAHQTLIMNNLRTRVKLETDGKLLTGRDLAIAALLGADEFGFATAPLIALGCVMMRVCNLDTCPVGIATQNIELRKNFRGKPEYIVNFMYMIANNLREYMAKLGFKTLDKMIGRTDLLKVKDGNSNISLDSILSNRYVFNKTGVHFEKIKEIDLSNTLDEKVIVPLCAEAIKFGKKTNISIEISNVNRTVGTILSSKITKIYGEEGLRNDTITINAYGNAGNSFGAFLCNGITINIFGDANDYLGKGLCGGKISLAKSKASLLNPENNIIAGNVILYGATSGDVYIDGVVGERFAVRNSGAKAVVLGVGAHGLEYMTGGCVLILGSVGRNLAAGMSGGVAYVLNTPLNRSFVNQGLVDITQTNDKDLEIINRLLEEHCKYTSSEVAANYIGNISNESFFKILPRDYAKIIHAKSIYLEEGNNEEEATLKAFYECTGQKEGY